jgi:hypothetical protein
MPPVEQLLALDTMILWRVVLAMQVWDATWEPAMKQGGKAWVLRNGPYTSVLYVLGWPRDDGSALPDPLTDPAAAWELETNELRGWETSGLHHRFRYDASWRERGVTVEGWQYGPWHRDRKHAAALAVLHKHQHGQLAPLITPLLERIEKEGLGT